MPSPQLHSKFGTYIDRIREYLKKNEMPATVIGAEYNNYKKVNKSGELPLKLSPKLKKRLEDIGPLGTEANDCIVGHCCEVSASNKILFRQPNLEIEDIGFTQAIRPRTLENINRCRNCKIVFG